ncbi:hypothetical protein OEZ85_011358 [Tetradesmus obliquus]|uniref:Uncharacterized protein n=1 Tax=Tetradesmus obliquus TaxID=3088 RepID=A0ABY8TQ39_TETOB|nr:hypothetical protein OEZ85_011358 [Tetradesmus obliquus]
MQQLLQQQRQQELQQQQRQLPSLQQLCMGVLGRHVTELVQQLQGQLSWLPADVKAALLAVARRRGELTGAVLAALADAEWGCLDLAGCRRLNAAEVLAAAGSMPHIRVLDVTGFDQLSAGGWRQLARAWPRLAILRLGGSAAASREALRALPHILPGILPPGVAGAAPAGDAADASASTAAGGAAAAAAAAAGVDCLGSWEDAYASDNEQDEEDATTAAHQTDAQQAGDFSQSSTCTPQQQHQAAAAAAAAAGDCRLKELRVLVWPDVPAEALDLVQRRCPRVAVNPSLLPDAASGVLPPPEVDPRVPLDGPAMGLVGPAALQDLPEEGCSSCQPGAPGPSIADRFRAAYIEQAARLRDKERRLWQQQQRRQLRSSHVLRTLNAWLDEPA